MVFHPADRAHIFIIANSDSQTAFLAMLLGIIVFVFAYFYKYDGRKLIFTVTAVGLLASPLMFLKSFENNLVKTSHRKLLNKKHQEHSESGFTIPMPMKPYLNRLSATACARRTTFLPTI